MTKVQIKFEELTPFRANRCSGGGSIKGGGVEGGGDMEP